MQGFTLGAGLASLAFWGFIASIVIAGIWYDIRKREAQHETVRRLFESGQPIDEQLMDRLLTLGGGQNDRLDRTFKLVALILLPAAVGLGALGLILGLQYPEATTPLWGAAVLVACIGLGCLGAARVAGRWYAADNSGQERQT